MVKKTAPQPVRDRRQLVVVYALSLLLLGMAIVQLVLFEGFVQTLITRGIADQQGAVALAIIVLTLQIFALPFLLRLWLSRLARAISAAFVLLVPALWLALSLQTAARPSGSASVGSFGDFIQLPDALAIGFSLLLVVMAIWSFNILGGPKAVKLR